MSTWRMRVGALLVIRWFTDQSRTSHCPARARLAGYVHVLYRRSSPHASYVHLARRSLPIPVVAACHCSGLTALVLQYALGFQPSPRFLESPCLYACVGLIAVSNYHESHASSEPIEPYLLPAFILVLLSWLHTKEPAAGWVVAVFMCVIAAAAGDCGGEWS